jgi:dienelactone hydrolase
MSLRRYFLWITLAALAWGAQAQENVSKNPTYQEFVLMVQRARGPVLETTIFLPRGDGPFPVAVINHGKAPGPASMQPRARFESATAEFLQRGYAVVLPMRTGFSKSGGGYSELCGTASVGRMWATDVEDVIGVLRSHPKLDWTRFALVGQSGGGLTVMALGERTLPGLRAIVNFAGGMSLTSANCFWKTDLVLAFGAYGAKSRYPTLWFYGANDSFFNQELAKEMHQVYTAGGGNAKLVAYGPFENDSHRTFASFNGRPIWIAETFAFLESHGLPSKIVYPLNDVPPAASRFAAVNDVDAVPYLNEQSRASYRRFLEQTPPRAFAFAPSGQFGWQTGGLDVVSKALERCEEKTPRKPCRLYAVDSTVVWTKEAPEH